MSTKPMKRFDYYSKGDEGEEAKILLSFHEFTQKHNLSRAEIAGLARIYMEKLDSLPIGAAVSSSDILPPLLTA